MPAQPSARTLYLVDGTAQLFRAYFAIPGLTNPQGLPTNTVYGFTTMLRKLMNDEKPVGFNWTRIEEGPRHVIGFITMMGSHPDYRGLGLGAAVMRAGVNYLREAEVDRVQLTVDSQNPSAHRIYTAAGFQRIAVTLWYERRL